MVSLDKALFTVVSVLLAQAVLFPYLLFKPSPAGIALNIYLILGVIILTVSLIKTAVNQQSEIQALRIFIDSMQAKGPRALLLKSIALIVAIIVWPATSFGLHFRTLISLKKQSVLQVAAVQRLIPPDLSIAIFCLSASVLSYLWVFAFSSAPYQYSIIFLGLLALSVTLRHLSYLADLLPAQDRLRRSKYNSFFMYSMICVADLVTLTLAFNAITNWNSGAILSAAQLKDVIAKLYGFKALISSVENFQINTTIFPALWVERLEMVSGLMFYFALAKGLFSYKNFSRTSSDYLALAIVYARLGRWDDALAMLTRFTPKTERELFEAACIYSAVGDFSTATDLATRYLAVSGFKQTNSHIAVVLTAGILAYEVTEERLWEFAGWMKNNSMPELQFNRLIDAYQELKSIPRRQVPDILVEKSLSESYKITYARACIVGGVAHRVLADVDNISPPHDGVALANWKCLLAQAADAKLSGSEKLGFLETWLQESLPVVEEVALVDTADLQKLILCDHLHAVEAIFDANKAHHKGLIKAAQEKIVGSISKRNVISELMELGRQPI